MYLTQCLHYALQYAPDRPMTIDGDRIRTTRESVGRIARLAAALQDLGVREGDRVGLLALNSDRQHELFFACWWMGAVAHPVNTRWSGAEIAYALADSGTEVLLVDDSFARLGPDLRERVPGLRHLVHCGNGAAPVGMLCYEDLVAAADALPDLRRGEDNLAFLLYTGGTTGVPKGVMVTHRSFLTAQLSSLIMNNSILPGGVNLLTAPLFHIGALLGWYSQSLLGGTLIFLPAFSPEAVLEAIQRHRVTSTTLVPVMVQMLCNHPDFGLYDTSSVRRVIYGAAGTPESTLRLAMKAFPGARFSQGYGMTETGVLSVLVHEDHERGGPRLRSAGRVTPLMEVAVVGPDGERLPARAVGEIVTRGEHVMAGYWGKPELTGQTVRDGWMHTGDGGRLDEDGYLYVVDRLKDMIITGGENVYSTEVENAVSAHPAVLSCAVIGVPDEHWGERVHAVIVLRSGQTATAEEIRAHCKSLIAGYKAPRSVDFVAELPLSATGKILKRELRQARSQG